MLELGAEVTLKPEKPAQSTGNYIACNLVTNVPSQCIDFSAYSELLLRLKYSYACIGLELIWFKSVVLKCRSVEDTSFKTLDFDNYPSIVVTALSMAAGQILFFLTF